MRILVSKVVRTDTDCPTHRSKTSAHMSVHILGQKQSFQVIVGPMKSGKTGEMLARLHRMERFFKKSVCLIKPKGSSREGIDEETLTSSRDGHFKRETIVVENIDEITDFDYDVFAFDEAQFLPGLDALARKLYFEMGKSVVISILNGRFDQTKFSGNVLGSLLPMASYITHMTSMCDFCTKEAYYSIRACAEEEAEEKEIGDDIYIVCCTECLMNRRKH